MPVHLLSMIYHIFRHLASATKISDAFLRVGLAIDAGLGYRYLTSPVPFHGTLFLSSLDVLSISNSPWLPFFLNVAAYYFNELLNIPSTGLRAQGEEGKVCRWKKAIYGLISSGLVRDMKFGYDEDRWVPEKQCWSHSVFIKRRQEGTRLWFKSPSVLSLEL